MIVFLLGVHINIGRLLPLACFLIVFNIIQCQLVLANHAAPRVAKTVRQLLNYTIPLGKTDNVTYSPDGTFPCEADSVNATSSYSSLPYRIFAGALMVPITICAISGNILVIYVIKHYHSLRITGNVFLASLAVADVGVSTLAMTFYGLQLLQGRWIFGAFMCRLWFSCDVLFSTASIMHLACIALDRYLSIVRPFDYERTASERRRHAMIAGCWIGSALLSFIPIFTGIYTTTEQRRKIDCLNHVHGRCIFAVNQAYAIVSSSFSFWVPGAVMIIIYLMLIKIADRKEKEAHERMDALVQRQHITLQNQYYAHRRSSDEQTFEMIPMTHQSNRNHKKAAATTTNGSCNHHRRTRKKDSIETNMERHPSIELPGNALDPRNSQMKHLRRERRAVKTLGAIMIAFLICWLPFFVRYTACEPNRCKWIFMSIIEDIVFWVGYFNSMINPFLYAFHNKDFRNAFKKTLCKYFVCCRERRTSTSSALPLPPATPSGEYQRPGQNRQIPKTIKIRTNSTSNINEQKLINTNTQPQGNNGQETSNGNVTDGENSTSSKHKSGSLE